MLLLSLLSSWPTIIISTRIKLLVSSNCKIYNRSFYPFYGTCEMSTVIWFKNIEEIWYSILRHFSEHNWPFILTVFISVLIYFIPSSSLNIFTFRICRCVSARALRKRICHLHSSNLYFWIHMKAYMCLLLCMNVYFWHISKNVHFVIPQNCWNVFSFTLMWFISLILYTKRKQTKFLSCSIVLLCKTNFAFSRSFPINAVLSLRWKFSYRSYQLQYIICKWRYGDCLLYRQLTLNNQEIKDHLFEYPLFKRFK